MNDDDEEIKKGNFNNLEKDLGIKLANGNDGEIGKINS